MEKALLTEYNTYVLVDRSGSMNLKAEGFPTRWDQAREITTGIAGLAQQVDEDGITLISFGGTFKKDRDLQDGVRVDAVANLFTSQTPNGSTPLHSALDAAFEHKFQAGKKAIIFVIGDGEPDDKDAVQAAIKRAASRIGDASQIRILFLQIGNEEGAATYLQGLDKDLKGAKYDIVNTVDYKTANGLTPDELYERAIKDTH